MSIEELSKNLQVLIKHFEELASKAQDTNEYIEYYTALITLRQSVEYLTLLNNMSYLLKTLYRLNSD